MTTPATSAPESNKTLVATPSKYVRNKNLLLFALVVGFFVMFLKDGVFAYAKENDRIAKELLTKYPDKFKEPANGRYLDLFTRWTTWKEMSVEDKSEAWTFIQRNSLNEKWHNALDIDTQVYIATALGGLSIVTIWWFFHCQKRKVVATESTLSPARGIEIPWSAITKIDNTKWKKSGIVWITYNDKGESHDAKLDEYHLDNLRPILQRMEENCPHAELISPPDAEEAAADASDENNSEEDEKNDSEDSSEAKKE